MVVHSLLVCYSHVRLCCLKQNVLKYGTKLSGLPLFPAHLGEFFHVDATAGQGVIYSVVVTDLTMSALNPKMSTHKFMSV
jgi:hypothetical protein